MDKKRWLLGVLALLLVAVVVLWVRVLYEENQVRNFSLESYEYYIEEFATDEKAEPIHTVKEAKATAKKLWVPIYGSDVKYMRPYIISFDEKNKVWHIEGSLSEWKAGGVPHLLVKEDGDVIAIWHDK